MAASAEEVRDEVYRLADAESRGGYLDYLRYVAIDSQPEPQLFSKAARDNPWQWDREEAIAPAIDHLAGITSGYRGPLNFWRGYPKGHDKTSGVGRRLNFLLAYSRRPLRLYACAGDRDQAALITGAMRQELALNPWLADRVEVGTLGASGASGSRLVILATDAATGQGLIPDYLIADEVVHWLHEEGRDFWNTVWSGRDKRPACVFEVCTNAGHIGSWQWDLRGAASRSPLWSFLETPPGVRLASWMNEANVAENRKLLDPGEARRLLDNQWIDPGEERGYLTLADAERCVDPALSESSGGEPGLRYYAVVDYGEVNDRTALCVMHNIPGTDRVVIDRLDCWQGSHDDRILIDIPENDPTARSVEGWLELTRRRFRLAAIVFDKFQMSGLAHKYERRNVRVERFEYNAGKRNYQMAMLLRTMVQNRKVTWSPEAGLLPGAEDDTFAKELARLVKKPMSYGFRWDHEAGRHDDRAAAVGMGLIYAVPETLPAGPRGPSPVPPPEAGPLQPVPAPKQDWVRKWNLNGVR